VYNFSDLDDGFEQSKLRFTQEIDSKTSLFQNSHFKTKLDLNQSQLQINHTKY